MYPAYFDRSNPRRNLFILDGNMMFKENWAQVKVHSFSEVVDVLFNQNGLAYVESLADKKAFPFLYEALQYPKTEIMCSKDGHPSAIKVQRKGSSRWIVPTERWERHINSELLPDMRSIYDFFGLTKPTPGSMGQALIRRSFQERKQSLVTSCNSIAFNFFRAHGVGGRCDVFHVGETFRVLLDIDMDLAYIAHCLWMPIGTVHRFINGNCKPYVTYFAECEVTIHEELALGPFPVKKGMRDGKIVYPTLPGRYRTWIWREQADAARDAGCTVDVKSGFGWTELGDSLASFCRYMSSRRRELRGTSIERDCKKIAVSGLGHFGMGRNFYRLAEDAYKDSPVMITDDGEPMAYFIREYEDMTKPSMLHWFNYFVSMTALSLYKYALPYAKEGRLIMTNYDSLLIIEKDERSRYAHKHGLDSLMAEAGDLRWQELTNVTILGSRSLKCDQKVLRPGVLREELITI